MKVKALRKLAQHELQKAPTAELSPRQSLDKMSQAPVERFENATTDSTRSPSDEKEHEVVRTERDDFVLHPSLSMSMAYGPSLATPIDMQFPEQPIACSANTETFSSNFRPAHTRPLFSPLDMGGQYQLHSPAPLWSLMPADMHQVSWRPGNVSLELADNTSSQHDAAISSEQLFKS
jgi:hypothetical protein